MPLITLLLVAAAHAQQSNPAGERGGRPRLDGNSSYISATTNEYNIRDRIDVTGHNFSVLAVGNNPNVGAGSHEGGLIWVEEGEQSYHLQNLGIELPKDGVREWVSDHWRCERLNVSKDVYTSVCADGEKRKSVVVSRSRGILSFTGVCPVIRINDAPGLCQYVLISPRGILAP